MDWRVEISFQKLLITSRFGPEVSQSRKSNDLP